MCEMHVGNAEKSSTDVRCSDVGFLGVRHRASLLEAVVVERIDVPEVVWRGCCTALHGTRAALAKVWDMSFGHQSLLVFYQIDSMLRVRNDDTIIPR